MTSKRRLVVSEIFPPQVGGSGRWLFEVYRRFPPGAAVVAAGLHAGAAEFDAESELPTERVDLHRDAWGIRGISQARGYWRMMSLLRGLVRRHGADEVHVARCLPEGFAAWLLNRLTGVPYVVYVHGEETRTSASSRELAWMTRRVFGGCRMIVANSENTKRVLRDEWGIAERKVQVLHPGVDTEWFTPAPPGEATRRELGWENRTVVLTAGRLQVRKGHDMLIRALPAIRERTPNVLYAIVGDGEERQRLERLARELNVSEQVRFHGEMDYAKLRSCYQQCDLFVLPNREVAGDFEGFGMVLLEAQACGKPVIAGDSGGTRETMKVGETGLIVDCRTPAPLADAVVSLLGDPQRRERMGIAARQWVEDRFDWEPLAAQARQLFQVNETPEPQAAFSVVR